MAKPKIEYLEKDLRLSIENDIKRVALYHSRAYRGRQAGFFSIPIKKKECEQRINVAIKEFPITDIMGHNRQTSVENQISIRGESPNRVGAVHV